ncbi:MAG: hypothetical protein AAF804_08160 [Bacteroidota bacterium]
MIFKNTKLLPLIALLTACPLLSHGQDFPKQKTEDHQSIRGTYLYLIPPDDFLPSTKFKGFQDPSDPFSMIMVMEIPGPIEKLEQGFNPELMATKGMKLVAKKSIQIANQSGFWVEVEQSANGFEFAKYVLVFGDAEASIMINGVYLQEDEETGEVIKESLESTFVDSSVDLDPRAALGYRVDETVGGMQFISVMGNAMLFNRDGKTPTESKDKANFIIDQAFADLQIGDKVAWCKTRLTQFPGKFRVQEEKRIEKITLDGLSGYALHAINEDDPTEAMYLVA